MKKYLLVIFGDFTSMEICQEIAITISPVVDSSNLKFQYTKGCIIFHFASEVEQTEIHDYIEISLLDMINAFILSEFNDKLSVYFPKTVKEHLFDLENAGNNGSIMVDLTKNDFDELDGEDENFVALLLNEVKKNITPPSLDQLLEKIKSKGVNCLTQYEKDILESYSKN